MTKELDCCCGNCKFIGRKVPEGWAGFYCSRLVDVSSPSFVDVPYLVGAGINNAYMIVEENFLCKKWLPKE